MKIQKEMMRLMSLVLMMGFMIPDLSWAGTRLDSRPSAQRTKPVVIPSAKPAVAKAPVKPAAAPKSAATNSAPAVSPAVAPVVPNVPIAAKPPKLPDFSAPSEDIIPPKLPVLPSGPVGPNKLPDPPTLPPYIGPFSVDFLDWIFVLNNRIQNASTSGWPANGVIYYLNHDVLPEILTLVNFYHDSPPHIGALTVIFSNALKVASEAMKAGTVEPANLSDFLSLTTQITNLLNTAIPPSGPSGPAGPPNI